MDCREAGIRLARALDGELGPAEQGPLSAHLAVCPACRALEAELTADAESLRLLSTDDVPDQALEQLRQRVMERIPNRRRRRTMWRVPAAAAAAVLLAVMLWPAPAPVEPPALVIAVAKPPAFAFEKSRVGIQPAPPALRVKAPTPPSRPLYVKLQTPDPNVVIYWMVEPKGDSE